MSPWPSRVSDMATTSNGTSTTYDDGTLMNGYTYASSYIYQPYPKIRTQEEITDTAIKNCFRQFTARQARFMLLDNYYKGRHRFPDDTTGSMVVSNLCGYITKALKGYLVGNRPKYVFKEEDVYGRQIVDLFTEQNKWLIDSELVQDMSIYGRAFELVYRDAADPRMPKSVRVSPEDAFVAYAGDVEQDSVFGAIRYLEVDENNVEHYTLYLYTRTDAEIWKSDSADGPWVRTAGPVAHGMGRVPLIEYANNRDYMGDFEAIIPLQDAYNQLLSDRLDDKTAFAQAMLRISGSTIGDTVEEIEENLKLLKQAKVLHLDTDSTADYLIKTMDESGVQVYQDQLKSDIHKEAMVPDLSDEQFANNASGVSMAYKLFGTDQMVADKIAQYEKGFRRRCKLYDAVLFNATASDTYQTQVDIGAMNIRFILNSPQDLSYMTTALSSAVASGYLSKRTATESLAIVDDADLEWKRIEDEQQKAVDQQKALFEDDYANPDGESYSDVEVVTEDEDDTDADKKRLGAA